MAQAATIPAPTKKEFIEIGEEKVEKGSKEESVLKQEFEPSKKYMFELATKNMERELPVIDMVTKKARQHEPFKPFQNIVLTSQIVWNGQRRNLRYYDGCTTIFQDKQPKDKDTIDQLIAQTSRDKYNFLKGKFGCYGDEKMLLLYLNICSWNAESDFRTRTAPGIFIPSNKDKQATIESLRLDQQEEALKLAKEATGIKMMIHANYLGIALVDYDSGNGLTEKEIRTEYRKKALSDAKLFIESYGNKSIETKYYIDKALQEGLINNKMNPNKAVWGNSNTEICDISGLRSHEAISEKLLEYSLSEEGEEFAVQLKAIYNN